MISIFSNTITFAKLNQDLDFLKKFCLKFKDENTSRQMSNRGGYQSINIFYGIHPELNGLVEEINKHVEDYAINIMRLKEKPSVSNLWINVNKYKDYNKAHVHPNSIISGVYYVKVPKNSGSIVFENSSDPSKYLHPEDVIEFNEVNSSSWEIKPKEDELLLFPSWLKHEVMPHLNLKEDRISIAFNT